MENVVDSAGNAGMASTIGMTHSASHSTRFPCNTCSRAFATNELQRDHMRSAWHISNLRRRVAGLPALLETEYGIESKTKTSIQQDTVVTDSRRAETRPAHQAQDKLDKEQIAVPSTQCLFCNLVSLSLDGNLAHMASVHSLFIPSPGQLIDVESFLGFLALLVFVEHECLYCGVEKADVESVQAHMRDKGHCMIRLDIESELVDFWYVSDGDGAEDTETENDTDGERNKKGKGNSVMISETEMRLPSGTVVNSRAASAIEGVQFKRSLRRIREKNGRTRQVALGQNPKDQPEDSAASARRAKEFGLNEISSERRIAVRGEMGLVGLSDNQRRALQVTEMKMKRREALTAAAHRHAIEQQPVKTMYFKTENPIYQAG